MRRLPAVSLALLTAMVLPVGAAQAQRLRPPPTATATAGPAPADLRLRSLPRSRDNTAALVLGGVAGAAAGMLVGGVAGVKSYEGHCEDCFLPGLFYGAVAGGSAALPLGVHLANGRRGSYGTSLLASLAIGGAGIGLAAATNEYGVMLAVPVVQLVSAVLIERRTGSP